MASASVEVIVAIREAWPYIRAKATTYFPAAPLDRCLCAREFFTKSFLGDHAAVLPGRAVREPLRHGIKLASRRWREGHDSPVAETRSDNLIYALTGCIFWTRL